MRSLLVIGGTRSGKSRYAQERTEAVPGSLAFIATAERGDAEMAERIARHQADRGPRWTAYEAPVDLPEAIRSAEERNDAILVDCITLWLSNLMLLERDVDEGAAALERAVRECRVPLAIVTNEVGCGIVPMGELARRFRDQAGWINQRLAAVASEVVLVSAGLPLKLK